MEEATLFHWGEAQTQYPARRSDPVTSFLAAERVNASQLEETVLQVLGAHPQGLTTEQIAAATGLSLVTVSPRLKPLERKRLVFRDGARANASGRQAVVWKAKLQTEQEFTNSNSPRR
jgi:predicted ArsR family transcriptional regulator